MSLSALSWAFDLPIRPASIKLVLLALSDCANAEHECYPCVETIIERTSLDRKTVIDALSSLESQGVIVDTKRRCGRTNQVRIFRLNGVPCSSRFHYVYKVIDELTGNYYIGVRSCIRSPDEDPYTGSGKWPCAMRKEGVVLTKEIIAEFENRAAAELCEIEEIHNHESDPLCKNEHDRDASRKSKGPKNGTVPISDKKSPVFTVKESRFSVEESQKRDTEPSVTVMNRNLTPTVRAQATPVPKDVEEVIAKGQLIGVSEADCRKWYRDCEACNWIRGDGTKFDHWPRQLIIFRDTKRASDFKSNGSLTKARECVTEEKYQKSWGIGK